MFMETVDAHTKQQALAFVRKNKLAVISTVSIEGKPEAATILYYCDNDFNFFFLTRNDTRKVVNLTSNKHVAIVIGTELGPSTMQMEGIAERVSAVEAQNEFIKELSKDSILNALYYGPFLNLTGINFSLYKVTITWARWLTLDLKNMREAYFQIV